jgi:hypothetical protein
MFRLYTHCRALNSLLRFLVLLLRCRRLVPFCSRRNVENPMELEERADHIGGIIKMARDVSMPWGLTKNSRIF